MVRLRAHNISMSVDGYMAGPSQSPDDPLGVGGERLHEWVVATRTFRAVHGGGEGGTTGVDDAFAARAEENIGATIMGRNMFGPIRGPWPDDEWTGWWGPNPPFHHDVFVLTHHARTPVTMDGGTTFHFVTDGIESALAQATAAAGGKDVRLGGGAATIRAYLHAGLLDELDLTIVPILLGGGERVFDGAGPAGYECVEFTASPAVAHVRFARAATGTP